MNDRLCNRIGLGQIISTGLIHLYFAFAEIDTISFAIVVANGGDEDCCAKFKTESWIAIGGFDFSDPGPTRFQ